MNIEMRPVGARSSFKHWHAGEDEFVRALDGEFPTIEGDVEAALTPCPSV